jgi:hypothetical protein
VEVKNTEQSRKFQGTINNPIDKGYTHEKILKNIETLKNIIYWCISDEVGEEGTYHTHFYVAAKNGIRFKTLKNLFPEAHFELCKGTSQENKDYIFKTGKWLKEKKHETNLMETHRESGEVPFEHQGKRNDIDDLYDMIKQGMTNYQILEEWPAQMLNIDKIERARQIVKQEQFKKEFRKINVTYIYGPTGTGKTRSVMEKHGYENVFRVTDYENPFDNYGGQNIIVFEEFHSSLKIQDMLNYLDGYPLELPCRYNNKWACYLEVYIITNITLNEQYEKIQIDYNETWQAFKRRIHNIIEYPIIDTSKFQSLLLDISNKC